MYNNRDLSRIRDAMKTSNIIGIDKLVLHTREFICPTIPKMTPKTMKELGERDEVLLVTRDGNEIRANSLYKATNRLKNATNVSINRYGLQVTLNPNKLYHEYYQCGDVKVLKHNISNLERELKEIGIIADVHDFGISRIDTANDRVMDRPYEDYAALYDSMQGKYMKCTSYTTGIVIKNKSRAVVWYDKGADMLRLTGEKIAEDNLTRNEVRLTKSESVRSKSYFNSVKNLIKHYDYKEEMHYRQVKEVLNSLNTIENKQAKIPYDDDIYLLRDTFDKFKNSHALYYLASVGGISELLSRYASIHEFGVKVIDQLTVHRQAKARLKEQVKTAYENHLRTNKLLDVRHKDIISMITEMKEKFVA